MHKKLDDEHAHCDHDTCDAHATTQPIRRDPLKNIGRNAPCPCQSGKKYKQCCLRS
jgi:uncharacterized protein YecA (UPF0149 family)